MSKSAVDVNNLPYADGDFYSFEQLLTDGERERLQQIRDFLAKEVKPIAVDYWNRAEFPMDLIPKLAELDVMSPVRRQGYSNLFAGLVHAEFTRADTSIATFMGVHDGLFTGSIEALASEEQKAEWLPDIYSLKKIGAFGLTEPLGGSDVAVAPGLPHVRRVESGSSTALSVGSVMPPSPTGLSSTPAMKLIIRSKPSW